MLCYFNLKIVFQKFLSELKKILKNISVIANIISGIIIGFF